MSSMAVNTTFSFPPTQSGPAPGCSDPRHVTLTNYFCYKDTKTNTFTYSLNVYPIDCIVERWKHDKYMPCTTWIGSVMDIITGWTLDEKGNQNLSLYGRVKKFITSEFKTNFQDSSEKASETYTNMYVEVDAIPEILQESADMFTFLKSILKEFKKDNKEGLDLFLKKNEQFIQKITDHMSKEFDCPDHNLIKCIYSEIRRFASLHPVEFYILFKKSEPLLEKFFGSIELAIDRIIFEELQHVNKLIFELKCGRGLDFLELGFLHKLHCYPVDVTHISLLPPEKKLQLLDIINKQKVEIDSRALKTIS